MKGRVCVQMTTHQTRKAMLCRHGVSTFTWACWPPLLGRWSLQTEPVTPVIWTGNSLAAALSPSRHSQAVQNHSTCRTEAELNHIFCACKKKKKSLRRRRNFSKEWWLETTPVRTVSQSTANNKWEEVKQQKGHVRLSGCNWFCYFFV